MRAHGVGSVGVLFFVGFGATARFIIPPSPTDSAQQTALMFTEHHTRIRLGLLITMFAAALLVPWSAAMFIQLRRAEGSFSPLPYVPVLCGKPFLLESSTAHVLADRRLPR